MAPGVNDSTQDRELNEKRTCLVRMWKFEKGIGMYNGGDGRDAPSEKDLESVRDVLLVATGGRYPLAVSLDSKL